MSETVSNQSNTLFYKRLVALEAIFIFCSPLMVSSWLFNQNISQSLLVYPGLANLLLYNLAWFWFLYRNHAWESSFLRFSSDFYLTVIKAGSQCFIIFAAYLYIMKDAISRLWLIISTIAIIVILLSIRVLTRFLLARNSRRVNELKYIYVGKEDQYQTSNEYFESYFGFSPFFQKLNPPTEETLDKWFKKYSEIVQKEDIYGVIIAVGSIQEASLLRRMADYKRDKVVEFLLESRIGALVGRFQSLDSPILLRVRRSAIVAGGAFLKRFFDIVFSLIVLVLTSPILIIVPLLIKVSSKGPVFYVDERLGQDLKTFKFPKFRTMYFGADKDRAAILGVADSDIVERYKRDPRIYPLGRFLRRWSIDELPQLWCVLIGTMSVVGPRPILQEELSQVHWNYEMRFMAKPGLTGLWQVTGRKEVQWKDRMIRDITYIDNWSLGYDLLLIVRTFFAILKGEGAR